MSRILITGAGGTIGSQVVEFLARRGHQVTGAWRNDPPQLDSRLATISLVQIDLTAPKSVEDLITPGKFDAIIHAAATIDRTNDPDNLRISIENNVQAHSNLVSAALKAGCPRLLFCSTISVYGGMGAGPSGYSEQNARPTSIYGWSKLAAEQVLDLAVGIGGLTAVSLRLAGVHGGSRKEGALYTISDAARRGRPIMLNDPKSRLRWLLIDDLLATFDVLLQVPLPLGHHVCNLASADTFTLLDVAETVKELCGSASPIEVLGSTERCEVMNIDRAIRLWGFAPTRLSTFLPSYLKNVTIQA